MKRRTTQSHLCFRTSSAPSRSIRGGDNGRDRETVGGSRGVWASIKEALRHSCVVLKRRNVADTPGGAGLTGHCGDREDSGGIWQCHERDGSDVPCQKASQRTSLFGGDMSLVLDSRSEWCPSRGHSRGNVRQGTGHVGLEMKREA